MSEKSPDFADLIRLAKDGDSEALGELLAKYRPYLRILADRQIGVPLAKRVDASDIVQQSLLEAHKAFGDFKGEIEAELVAWLTRILDRDVTQTIRDQTITQKRAINREQPIDETGTWNPAADQSSPSQRAMKGEQAIRLARVLETLPDDQREAVRLRHLEGWALADIAKQLDKSTVAVAGLIKRGMSALKVKLKEED